MFAIAHKLLQNSPSHPRSVSVLIILIAACSTIKAAAYSAAVADVTTVLMIRLKKQAGAFGASLSSQSQKNKIPQAFDRASELIGSNRDH